MLVKRTLYRDMTRGQRIRVGNAVITIVKTSESARQKTRLKIEADDLVKIEVLQQG